MDGVVGGYPRYDTYKPAQSLWLKEVPSHWKLLPGLAVLKENKEKNIGMVEETVLSLSYGKVTIKPPEKLTGLVPESFETYQVISPNDIIIRPTDLQNDQTSLRTGIAKDRGIITSAYICLRPELSHNATFIHYLLHAYDLLKVFYGMGSGLRQNLDYRDFKRLEICIPPRDEQDRIANFLDQKTAEIDEAIAKKQRLIELLQEQKAILINQAVTKGLNPDVSMRDSGVEWIGEIPAHWEVTRLKFATKFIVDCLHATPKYADDGEYPAIRTADIVPGQVKIETALKVKRETYEKWIERAIPIENDILYSREGERYGIAAPVPKGTKLCISQRMMHFRTRNDMHPLYLMWQLNCKHVYLQALPPISSKFCSFILKLWLLLWLLQL